MHTLLNRCVRSFGSSRKPFPVPEVPFLVPQHTFAPLRRQDTAHACHIHSFARIRPLLPSPGRQYRRRGRCAGRHARLRSFRDTGRLRRIRAGGYGARHGHISGRGHDVAHRCAYPRVLRHGGPPLLCISFSPPLTIARQVQLSLPLWPFPQPPRRERAAAECTFSAGERSHTTQQRWSQLPALVPAVAHSPPHCSGTRVPFSTSASVSADRAASPRHSIKWRSLFYAS